MLIHLFSRPPYFYIILSKVVVFLWTINSLWHIVYHLFLRFEFCSWTWNRRRVRKVLSKGKRERRRQRCRWFVPTVTIVISVLTILLVVDSCRCRTISFGSLLSFDSRTQGACTRRLVDNYERTKSVKTEPGLRWVTGSVLSDTHRVKV